MPSNVHRATVKLITPLCDNMFGASMKFKKLRLGSGGEVKLPLELRRTWGLEEGSELLLFYDEEKALLKPVREPEERLSEEVEFSVLDPLLVSLYYERRQEAEER